MKTNKVGAGDPGSITPKTPAELAAYSENKTKELEKEMAEIESRMKQADGLAKQAEKEMAETARTGQTTEYRAAREKYNNAISDVELLRQRREIVKQDHKAGDAEAEQIIKNINDYCDAENEAALKKLAKLAREMFETAKQLDAELDAARNATEMFLTDHTEYSALERVAALTTDRRAVEWGYDVVVKYSDLYRAGSGEAVITGNISGIVLKDISGARFIKAE